MTFEDGSGGARLRTVQVDGPSLAGAAMEAEEIAGVVAALASTLADLHAMGLVHGAVAPEHVVLDDDGRPVLCSLGYGGLAGERPAAAPLLLPPFADPTREEDGRLHPALDVYGLGALLETLLAGAEGRSRRSSLDALRQVAEQAMAPARSDRPGARHLAEAVHDAVQGRPPPSPTDGAGASGGSRRAGRRGSGPAGGVAPDAPAGPGAGRTPPRARATMAVAPGRGRGGRGGGGGGWGGHGRDAGEPEWRSAAARAASRW